MGSRTFDALASGVQEIAIKLSILQGDGSLCSDPDEVSDEYLLQISTNVRAFLVLCSSELEEFIEAKCLAFLAESVGNDAEAVQHHCIHALSLYFRNQLTNFIEKRSVFVDFYATDQQARRFSSPKRTGRDNVPARTPLDSVILLNKKTLIGKLCHWYREEVVASNHGMSDKDLISLMIPLGFSGDLVKEECSSLCAALQSLAAARGEAAHRSAGTGGWPFAGLPAPLEQQMSLGDAWKRWEAVRDCLDELDDFLHRVPQASNNVVDVRMK